MNATLIMAFILILIVVATVITKKLPFNFVLFIAPVLCALILGHSIEETSTFIVEQLASMMKSAAGQLGAVSVMSITTSPSSCKSILYISPKSYTLTGISGSYTVFSISTILSSTFSLVSLSMKHAFSYMCKCNKKME